MKHPTSVLWKGVRCKGQQGKKAWVVWGSRNLWTVESGGAGTSRNVAEYDGWDMGRDEGFASNLWNLLPQCTIMSTSLDVFKRGLNKFMIRGSLNAVARGKAFMPYLWVSWKQSDMGYCGKQEAGQDGHLVTAGLFCFYVVILCFFCASMGL